MELLHYLRMLYSQATAPPKQSIVENARTAHVSRVCVSATQQFMTSIKMKSDILYYFWILRWC